MLHACSDSVQARIQRKLARFKSTAAAQHDELQRKEADAAAAARREAEEQAAAEKAAAEAAAAAATAAAAAAAAEAQAAAEAAAQDQAAKQRLQVTSTLRILGTMCLQHNRWWCPSGSCHNFHL